MSEQSDSKFSAECPVHHLFALIALVVYITAHCQRDEKIGFCGSAYKEMNNLVPFAARQMYELIRSLFSQMDTLLQSFSSFHVPPSGTLAQTHISSVHGTYREKRHRANKPCVLS